MIGLGEKIYYNYDGTIDWLRTIVRSVYMYRGPSGAIFVVSIAAKRAQRLYRQKTEIGGIPWKNF